VAAAVTDQRPLGGSNKKGLRALFSWALLDGSIAAERICAACTLEKYLFHN